MNSSEDDAVAQKLMQPHRYQDTEFLSWDVSWQALIMCSQIYSSDFTQLHVAFSLQI